MKSDSLDNISLDSDDIRSIERFENNYYNHKNNILQNGGSNKLEKNIVRLFNCYVLSLNQNGGAIIHDDLSSQIKQRLNKKIVELSNDFIGGGILDIFLSDSYIKDQIINKINKNKNKDDIIKGIIMSLDKVILEEINDSELGWVQRILKAPTNNTDYKSWLNNQIKNWINKNRDVIFNQILTHIKNFIDPQPTNVPVTTKASQNVQPTLLDRYPAKTDPGTNFLLKQAPPKIVEALDAHRIKNSFRF